MEGIKIINTTLIYNPIRLQDKIQKLFITRFELFAEIIYDINNRITEYHDNPIYHNLIKKEVIVPKISFLKIAKKRRRYIIFKSLGNNEIYSILLWDDKLENLKYISPLYNDHVKCLIESLRELNYITNSSSDLRKDIFYQFDIDRIRIADAIQIKNKDLNLHKIVPIDHNSSAIVGTNLVLMNKETHKREDITIDYIIDNEIEINTINYRSDNKYDN